MRDLVRAPLSGGAEGGGGARALPWRSDRQNKVCRRLLKG